MGDVRPVVPEVLRYIDDYVKEENINSAAYRDELDAESNLIVFYRSLFAQLFANVIQEPITGVGQKSGEKARELYERHRGSWTNPLRVLVKDFQHFSKIYPDLLGEVYGRSDAVSDLHLELLPSVLHHLEEWARESGQMELAAAAAASRQRYTVFVGELEPMTV